MPFIEGSQDIRTVGLEGVGLVASALNTNLQNSYNFPLIVYSVGEITSVGVSSSSGVTWLFTNLLNNDGDDWEVNFSLIVPPLGWFRINGTTPNTLLLAL